MTFVPADATDFSGNTASVASYTVTKASTTAALGATQTLVAADGSGNFTSIQAAVNTIGATAGGSVYVKPGTYAGDVTVVQPNVSLRGLGGDPTQVILTHSGGAFGGSGVYQYAGEFNTSQANGAQLPAGSSLFNGDQGSATLVVAKGINAAVSTATLIPNGFYGENFTLLNTYDTDTTTTTTTYLPAANSGTCTANQGPARTYNDLYNNSIECASQALAIYTTSDLSVMNNIYTGSLQDTIYAGSQGSGSNGFVPARQYWFRGKVQGQVDYIFGDAAAVFDFSTIYTLPKLSSITGTDTIEAQNKANQTGSGSDYLSGYVMNSNVFTSYTTGMTGLEFGRPYGKYSTYVMLNSYVDQVNPGGYIEFSGQTNLPTSTYGEFNDLLYTDPATGAADLNGVIYTGQGGNTGTGVSGTRETTSMDPGTPEAANAVKTSLTAAQATLYYPANFLGATVPAALSSVANFNPNATLAANVNGFASGGTATSIVGGTSVTILMRPQTPGLGAITNGTYTIPTGTYTLVDTYNGAATTVASGTLDASGEAYYTSSTLNAGAHSFVWTYSGDANFSGSTASAYALQVNGAGHHHDAGCHHQPHHLRAGRPDYGHGGRLRRHRNRDGHADHRQQHHPDGYAGGRAVYVHGRRPAGGCAQLHSRLRGQHGLLAFRNCQQPAVRGQPGRPHRDGCLRQPCLRRAEQLLCQRSRLSVQRYRGHGVHGHARRHHDRHAKLTCRHLHGDSGQPRTHLVRQHQLHRIAGQHDLHHYGQRQRGPGHPLPRAAELPGRQLPAHGTHYLRAANRLHRNRQRDGQRVYPHGARGRRHGHGHGVHGGRSQRRLRDGNPGAKELYGPMSIRQTHHDPSLPGSPANPMMKAAVSEVEKQMTNSNRSPRYNGNTLRSNTARMLATALAAAGAASLLTGCGMTSAGKSAATPIVTAAHHTTGNVHGGQQPVAGAVIQLYAVGTGGLRSVATPLIAQTITSDANGNFDITYDYNCPAGSYVYLTATGGNPGGGTNSALSLVAALGYCTNLNAATYISLNEVTTVAAGYALAPFAADLQHIGTTSNNVAGIATAFANAQVIANFATGSAPGAGLPTGVTVPVAEINTLADIIASCVNTTGSASSQCSTLFSATGASDTFGAALAIARNPGAPAITQLYTLSSGTAPFQPTQTGNSAPNDYTLAVKTTGGGTLSTPYGIAIDAGGYAYVSNESGTTVAALNPTNAGLSNSIAAPGVFGPQGVAVDKNANLWIANTAGNSVVKVPVTGTTSGTPTSYTTNLSAPSAVAIDSAGNAFVSNFNGNSVTEITAAGAVQTPFTGNANITLPQAIAVGPAGSVYVTSGNGSVVKLTNAGVYQSTLNDGSLQGTAGVAVDSAAHVLATGFTTGTTLNGGLSEFTSTGAAVSGSPATTGLTTPQGVATDGVSVWIANGAATGGLVQYTYGSTAPMSPAAGYGTMSAPVGVAVDASGCVWVTSSGDNTVSKFIGLSSPILTPIAVNVGP